MGTARRSTDKRERRGRKERVSAQYLRELDVSTDKRERRGRGAVCVAIASALWLGTAPAAHTETPTAPPAAEPAARAGAPSARPTTDVVVLDYETSWDAIGTLFMGGSVGVTPFSDSSVYVIRGNLKNASATPVHHVVLEYQLLDSAGNVVFREEGYNRSAESVREGETGKPAANSEIVPIPPGGPDTFRMIFFGDELPQFTGQKVRILEVH